MGYQCGRSGRTPSEEKRGSTRVRITRPRHDAKRDSKRMCLPSTSTGMKYRSVSLFIFYLSAVSCGVSTRPRSEITGVVRDDKRG